MESPPNLAHITSVEDLLEEIGGLGKFQLLFIFILYCNLLPIGWSTQQMTFAGVSPDWYCATGAIFNKTEGIPANIIQACTVKNTYTGNKVADCARIRFFDSVVSIVTEWDLVCDLSWVKKAAEMVELGGSLLGALLAGQSATSFGRRKSAYAMVAFHAVMNFITGFSMNWKMFVACRFFIGIGIGGVLVLVFPYAMEFVSTKWRPLLAIIPYSTFGIAVFAGVASSLENWSYLHLICGLFALPGLFGYLFLPESIRWLTVRGRLEEAEEIYDKIAAVNGKTLHPLTEDLLQKIYQREQQCEPRCKQYSYIDLFTDRDTIIRSLSFGFIWLSFAMAYHTVSEQLEDLLDDRYLNTFIVAIVELPLLFLAFFASNIFGRSMSTFIITCIYSLIFLVCLIVNSTVDARHRANFTQGLCLTAKAFMGAGWAVLMTWAAEVYPTVTRFLGYGIANSFARIGFLLAHAIIDTESSATAAYAVCTVLSLACIGCTFVLPETKDATLSDSPTFRADDTGSRSRSRRYRVEEPDTGVYQETGTNAGVWTCHQNIGQSPCETGIRCTSEEEGSDSDRDEGQIDGGTCPVEGDNDGVVAGYVNNAVERDEEEKVTSRECNDPQSGERSEGMEDNTEL